MYRILPPGRAKYLLHVSRGNLLWYIHWNPNYFGYGLNCVQWYLCFYINTPTCTMKPPLCWVWLIRPKFPEENLWWKKQWFGREIYWLEPVDWEKLTFEKKLFTFWPELDKTIWAPIGFRVAGRHRVFAHSVIRSVDNKETIFFTRIVFVLAQFKPPVVIMFWIYFFKTSQNGWSSLGFIWSDLSWIHLVSFIMDLSLTAGFILLDLCWIYVVGFIFNLSDISRIYLVGFILNLSDCCWIAVGFTLHTAAGVGGVQVLGVVDKELGHEARKRPKRERLRVHFHIRQRPAGQAAQALPEVSTHTAFSF